MCSKFLQAPMQLSVVMCTRNGVNFIEEQLRSIAAQTLLPNELVISDDGSTDSTKELISTTWEDIVHENEHARAIKIRLIEREIPLGVTGNFEAALGECTGDFIALSDQDDVWEPTRLEKQFQVLSSNPDANLTFCNLALIDENGESLGSTSMAALGLSKWEAQRLKYQDLNPVLLRRNVVTGAGMMIRKTLLSLARPFPPSWIHDEWLALVASFAGPIPFDSVCLVKYRQHSNNEIGLRPSTLRHNIGRIIHPRTLRNQILLTRAEESCSHHFFSTNQNSIHQEIEGKLQHESARSAYPAARLKRFRPVMQEIRSGRYQKFGLGLKDVVRDLLQPV